MIASIGLILASALRLATPLAFAASGEYIAERAGMINISIEAMMISGAFAAIWGATLSGSTVVGLLFGMVAGLVVAFIHANFSHRLTVNTYVVGLTLNLLALGLTSFLLQVVNLGDAQVARLRIPVLADLPIVGQALFDQRWPAYLLWLIIPAVWWSVYRTRWGLNLRAIGENPVAVDATGIDVLGRQRQALLISGILSGLGGAYISIGEVGSFNQDMTSGRGYVVIATIIFGGWRLKGTILGCLLFGAADAMRLALPALGITLNSQLLIASPYILAIVAMVFFAKTSKTPSAYGQAFARRAT